jgi:hypothetical protein
MMLVGFAGFGFAGYLASRTSRLRCERMWLDLANFGSSAPQKMSTATPVVGGNKLPFDDNKR